MIRVAVMYPNEPGKRLDWGYYMNQHKAMEHQKLDALGLVRTEVDKGMGTVQPGAPAPFVAVGYMYFNSMADLQKCLACAAEIMSDIPNFTDIRPQIQISEVL
jgi:uncharacterized protein (TIGR02118 family)